MISQKLILFEKFWIYKNILQINNLLETFILFLEKYIYLKYPNLIIKLY